MACGCRKQMGNFSSQKNTWSQQSSLNMANWDPYPELQNPKNLYGSNTVEKYCSSNCDIYKIEASPISLSASTPITERNVLMFKESYNTSLKGKSYLTIKDIWNNQKPYST